ncbi:MAG: SurA N-terminal domain-containing protein [Gemmatimonadales bacterium]|nr:SurA N-terminal domain-containing protein [Gemmatimonadales bacterium]
MMQAFRNAAKPVMIVVAITFFIWLVWDLSGLGSGTGSIFASRSVGKVNGESIDIRVFDQQVQNASAEYQQRGITLGLDQMHNVRDQVWDQTVQSILLRREYEKRGLRVSDAEIVDAIRNLPLPDLQQVPTFQTNGQFDLEKYQRWLASAEGQQYIPVLEAQYREQLLQAKLFRSVVADVFVSDAALWERYRDERERVRIGLVRIDPGSAVAAPATPISDAEATEYYNAHKEQFRRSKAAFLSYLYVPRVPNAADSAAALARARSVRTEIAGGTSFDEVAARESADSVSARRGGDLGEMNRNSVVPEFGNAAMTLPLNTLSEPVLSPFGYHIIRVESRSGDTFKARHILVPVEIVGDHRDQLDAVADSLENLAAEQFEFTALDTAAAALKLTVGQTGPVAEGARVVVPEAGQVPDAGVWAFQAKPGEHSQVIEAPSAFFLFRLDSLRREGLPPLAAVRAEVDAAVRTSRQVAEAKQMAERLSQQVAGGAKLSAAAATLGLQYQELGPFARLTAPIGSPSLIGTAFALKPGQLSRPTQADSASGDFAVYLLEGLERLPADSADFVSNLAVIRQQALQSAQRSRVQAYLATLRASAKIVDRRSEVYRTPAQQAAATAALPTIQ